MTLAARTRVKPPATFTATANSDSRITVAWSALSAGFRLGLYILSRSSDGVNFTVIAQTTAITYSDTGLTPVTTYIYHLQVQDDQGHFSPTITASATTQSVPVGTAIRRYAGGHYVALSFSQMGGNPGQTYTGIPNPGVRNDTGPVAANVKALVVPHYLRDVNPTGTTYDYTRLDQDITQCAAFPNGGVLVFWRFFYRTFGGDLVTFATDRRGTVSGTMITINGANTSAHPTNPGSATMPDGNGRYATVFTDGSAGGVRRNNCVVTGNTMTWSPALTGNAAITVAGPASYFTNPLPADIEDAAEAFVPNPSIGGAGGWTSWVWSPRFQDRYRTICQKIGARYNANPYFGGISTQETSLGSADGGTNAVYTVNGITGNDAYTHGYTPGAGGAIGTVQTVGHLPALLQMVDSISDACPNARAMVYQNFLSGSSNTGDSTLTAAQADDALLLLGVKTQAREGLFGGPDLVLGGSLTTRAYPNYRLVHAGSTPVAGRGATFCSMQPAEWNNGSPANSPQATPLQRFNYAIGSTSGIGANAMPSGTTLPSLLNLDIINWDWHTSGTYTFTKNAVPIFGSNPTFGTYAPPVTSLTNFIYVDLNAGANGSGTIPTDPTNVLPAVLDIANTTLLFNGDNGVQTIPAQGDLLALRANNLTIGSYGAADAVISGFEQFTSGWTQVSGNIYKRTYNPATGFVGCAINISDTTGSTEGTVLNWTNMGTPASFVPSTLAVNSYAYDWSAGVMYVNVGANANTKTIGISCVSRFISVGVGDTPTTVTIQNLKIIGFSRTGINVVRGASAWHITRCSFYAIGGYFNPSTTSPPGTYEGTAISFSNSADNMEVDNCYILQSFKSAFTVLPSTTAGETISTLRMHHNTIRYWSLSALGFIANPGSITVSGVEFDHNICTSAAAGFSGIGDAAAGLIDGVQIRGTGTTVSGLNIHDNTLDAFDANIALRAGTCPGGVAVTNNRLSSAKYGIRNIPAAITVNASGNQFCANAIADVTDVNQSPTTSINGGTYSGNTSQAAQCFTPDLSTQGVQ